MPQSGISILLIVFLLACNQDKSADTGAVNLSDTLSSDTSQAAEAEEISSNDSTSHVLPEPELPDNRGLNIYVLQRYNHKGHKPVGFISLSDSYPLSEHPDSLAVPEEYLGGTELTERPYIILKDNYRNRLLNKTRISETDQVFMYDYLSDTIVTLTVKNLNAIALLNHYSSLRDQPFPQYYYMIGFEVKEEFLPGFSEYYTHTFVSIGKNNPFNQGGIQPMLWEKADSSILPTDLITRIDTALKPGQFRGDVFTYEKDGLLYLIQNIMIDQTISGRRLFVFNEHARTQTLITERTYAGSEGASLAPLHLASNPGILSDIDQWAGKLFKGRPPVVFGFMYFSFSCPPIEFITSPGNRIYISCDNRH